MGKFGGAVGVCRNGGREVTGIQEYGDILEGKIEDGSIEAWHLEASFWMWRRRCG